MGKVLSKFAWLCFVGGALLIVQYILGNWYNYSTRQGQLFFPWKDVELYRNIWKYALNITNSSSEHVHMPVLDTCPVLPTPNATNYSIPMKALPYSDLMMKYPALSDGGTFIPESCIARENMAIIIPYRDRDANLRMLLDRLHCLLPKHLLQYQIFVVEMAMPTKFNRASLLNVGYLEAKARANFSCYVFHDVDKYPINDQIRYGCDIQPRHMLVYHKDVRGGSHYRGFVGGVLAMTSGQMEKINGYSNEYFGWGGEDDDGYMRIIKSGMKIVRHSPLTDVYASMPHGKDATNPRNKSRMKLLKEANERMFQDGLNSIQYEILNVTLNKLYTKIYISLQS